MAKKVKAVIKLQIPAGQANPAPPVGPALGQHGVNMMNDNIHGLLKGFLRTTDSTRSEAIANHKALDPRPKCKPWRVPPITQEEALDLARACRGDYE